MLYRALVEDKYFDYDNVPFITRVVGTEDIWRTVLLVLSIKRYACSTNNLHSDTCGSGIRCFVLGGRGWI